MSERQRLERRATRFSLDSRDARQDASCTTRVHIVHTLTTRLLLRENYLYLNINRIYIYTYNGLLVNAIR